MSVATRPPRVLVLLIAATTVVPLSALLWLGWRLIEQDRVLQAEQGRARIEQATDAVVAALQRAVGVAEQRLAVGSTDWPDGAVALTLFPTHVDAAPRGRLPYLPAAVPLPSAPGHLFARAEQLEFAARDRAAAVSIYRRLGHAADPHIRAGALVRLGRTLADFDPDEALGVYARLLEVDDVVEGETPIGLIARYARCVLFEKSRRDAELRAEATRLVHDLQRGRWLVTREIFTLYVADGQRWLRVEAAQPTRQPTLADAAVRIWEAWQAADGRVAPPRETLILQGVPVIVLRQRTAAGQRALLATPSFVESEWLRPAAAVAQAHGIHVELRDSAGRTLFGDWSGRAPHATAAVPLSAARTEAQAALPWTVVATGDVSPERARFAGRRRLFAAGLALLVFMAVAAAYFILRAVSRELAVARLHAGFVAAVSHEFRTPLTTLRQFTEMLRDRPQLDEETRRVCYDAQARATERLTRLVESVLDFKRMEAGARTYEFGPRDCTAFVRGIVEEFSRQPEAASHAIAFSGNGSILVRADRDALARAIWNLLDNAVKYSPDRPRIRVAVTRRDRTAAIAVQDEGIGLNAAERAALFTRFRRGEQAVKRGIRGTGIGLAMVQEIVAAHGGRIDVDSQPDAGSTFTILLPAED